MDNSQLKRTITTSWFKPIELEHAEGAIVALDSEQNELKFSTYYIKGKYFTKIWAWQFGNQIEEIKAPTTIHYWKMLKDCHFDQLTWKSIKEIPEVGQDILCWINYGKWDPHNATDPLAYNYRIPLQYPATRLHFGTFTKGLFGGKYLDSGLPTLKEIPWSDIFRWTTVDEFAEKNEDPRKFPIDPLNFFSLDWMTKKP